MEDFVQEEYLSTVKVSSHRQLYEENAPLFRGWSYKKLKWNIRI